MPQFVWLCWVGLCALVLLNGNAVSAMAGLPLQFFTPPMLLMCIVIIVALRGEVRNVREMPAIMTAVFSIVFLCTALASSIVSDVGQLDVALGWWGAVRYLASLLLLFTAFCVSTRCCESGRVGSLLKLLFWMTVIASISGYLLSAIPEVSERLGLSDESGRLTGVFGNANELGLQAGYPIVFGAGLAIRLRRIWWSIVGILASGIGVVGSFSKTAMLMFVFLMVIVTWEGLRQSKKSPMISVTLVLVGVLCIGAAFYLLDGIVAGTIKIDLSSDQQRRLEQVHRIVFAGVVDDETTTGRTSIWEEGIAQWRKSPVIGCGLTSFDVLPGIEMNSHNSLLVVLGEAGLVGMASFLVMVVAWTTTLWRCGSRDIRIIGVLFLAVQAALWMSSGQAMSLRGHNLVCGCVMGILVVAGRRNGRLG